MEAYQGVKDFQKVIHYLNQLNSIYPYNAKVHFDLANAYLNFGDESNAVKEIKKAAELDPLNFGSTSGKFIDSLNK